ncbi:hypothetical protein K435DRAFT_811821 [Dendrothele bispora CBS 962.96]|uniref:Uncharacterized protein n=1 Tax=Dendrothele bispora (strain CBS 962.96) TaxID=1314807 RepID=A0A4S8KQX4_DENBC|nr:hypothetical protein K435DRAFT_811821 [Dendrothele bispora CBS 962.96]
MTNYSYTTRSSIDEPVLIQLCHPSNVLNDYYLLATFPDCHAAITHNNDWCNLFDNNMHDSEMPDHEELVLRAKAQYEILNENGCAFFQKPSIALPVAETEIRDDVIHTVVAECSENQEARQLGSHNALPSLITREVAIDPPLSDNHDSLLSDIEDGEGRFNVFNLNTISTIIVLGFHVRGAATVMAESKRPTPSIASCPSDPDLVPVVTLIPIKLIFGLLRTRFPEMTLSQLALVTESMARTRIPCITPPRASMTHTRIALLLSENTVGVEKVEFQPMKPTSGWSSSRGGHLIQGKVTTQPTKIGEMGINLTLPENSVRKEQTQMLKVIIIAHDAVPEGNPNLQEEISSIKIAKKAVLIVSQPFGQALHTGGETASIWWKT